MSNILTDIVEDINVKPSKSKLVIKWIVSISLTLITAAFIIGQFKSSFFNRLDKFEKSLDNNTQSIVELKQEMADGFDALNARVDKVYDDGYKAFDDFQQYNNKQLGLIIDYGSSNKDLLKRMLEVNTLEKSKNVESQLEQAKAEPLEFKIGVKPIQPPKKNEDYISLVISIAVGTTDTSFSLRGATKEYIDKIDRNKYRVGAIIANDKHPGFFDVNYTNK
jgi:hypothetical protein